MRLCSQWHTVLKSTVCVLALCIKISANDKLLSREESLGALYLGADSEFEVLMFVNPAILPSLRKIVASYPELPAKTAWTAIGCVGTERDVAYIRALLEKDCRGEFEPQKALAAESAIKALGLLARRRIPGATQLLDEMKHPKFWEGEPIWFFKGALASRSNDEIQALILDAMGRAKDPGVAKRAESLRSQIKDPVKLGIWDNRVLVDRLLKVGSTLDKLEKEGLNWKRREVCLFMFHNVPLEKRVLLGLPPRPTARELVSLREASGTRQMAQSAPRADLSPKESESLIREAKEKHFPFLDEMAKENFKDIHHTLLVKGDLLTRQFPPEDIPKREEEFKSLQTEERSLIQSLPARMDVEDAVASIEADAGDYSGKYSEVIVVSWKLKGTQLLGQRIVERGLNIYPTIAGDDSLVVVMKKKNGIWYWNPFGW